MDAMTFAHWLIENPDKGLIDLISRFSLREEEVEELTTSDVVRNELDGWLASEMEFGWPCCPRCAGRAQRLLYGLVDDVGVEYLKRLSPDMLRQVLAGRIALGGCVVREWRWACQTCGNRWLDERDESEVM